MNNLHYPQNNRYLLASFKLKDFRIQFKIQSTRPALFRVYIFYSAICKYIVAKKKSFKNANIYFAH